MQMSNQEHQSTGVTPSNPDGSITITPAIWAKMQTLLALLPEQQDVAKSIALPPDKPSTSLLASLPASPADDSFDPADVPPSEALDEKESDINDSLPNSNRSGNANEDVSAPSFININRDPIPDNNLISNKPDSVADKAPSPPGNTAPLKVISNIEGYKYTTVGPLDPPPPARFGSMDNLVGFCQSWAKNHGYAIAKSNSHPGKNVYIKCAD
ncbi:hypothetical protein PCANC_00016 [Puccinia coronata f. sp. avenae]|uniref:Uncharacterized protein n=1 Tax=Puccinia coronata f. sp. avenae TaxID=200324 RepID=A0A2N5W8N4_9BASI|nr:hypothetical protein PCANC_00016 [Puccinia coronata f. sp. avenae]